MTFHIRIKLRIIVLLRRRLRRVTLLRSVVALGVLDGRKSGVCVRAGVGFWGVVRAILRVARVVLRVRMIVLGLEVRVHRESVIED